MRSRLFIKGKGRILKSVNVLIEIRVQKTFNRERKVLFVTFQMKIEFGSEWSEKNQWLKGSLNIEKRQNTNKNYMYTSKAISFLSYFKHINFDKYEEGLNHRPFTFSRQSSPLRVSFYKDTDSIRKTVICGKLYKRHINLSWLCGYK